MELDCIFIPPARYRIGKHQVLLMVISGIIVY